MEKIKKGRGSTAQGIAPRQTSMRVAAVDKPLLETYRALLDNPSTRSAAIEALNMVQQFNESCI